MDVKKLDDSKVDEIVKKSEAGHDVSGDAIKKIFPKIKIRITKETASSAVILILLALALIQSVELINLRQQIKSGQFGGANSGSSGNTQKFPSQ